jgi:hypothetical protein
MPAFMKIASEALAARGLLSGLGKTVKDVTSDLEGAVSGVTGGMFGQIKLLVFRTDLVQISPASVSHYLVRLKPSFFPTS